MTSIQSNITLPPIISESSRYPSAKELKFKKISLLKSQIQSARLSQKSLPKRNISSNSLMSSPERRQQKKQRLMLNIIQRKMNEGRYNQNEEITNDLNQLKLQQSQFTTKISGLENEIQKLREKIIELKNTRGGINNEYDYYIKKVYKLNENAKIMKEKCDQVEYEKAVYINSVSRQTNDNLLEFSQINLLKQQMKKKTVSSSLLQKKQIESFERQKEIQKQCRALRKNHLVQSRKMQQLLMQRQKGIQQRAASEILRWQRKKQLIEISQSVIIEDSKKTFNKFYYQILAQQFLSFFNNNKLNRIISRNQRMVSLFNEASNMYGPLTPEEYPERFLNSEPERLRIQQNIKQLEKTVSQYEHKNRQAQDKLMQLKTQYLSMGALLEKEHHQMIASQMQNRNSNQKAEEKIYNIKMWIANTLKRFQQIKHPLEDKSTIQKQIQFVLKEIENGLLKTN